MNEQNNEIGNQLVVVITTLLIYIAIVQEITNFICQNSQNILIKKLTHENNNNLEGKEGNRTSISSIS
jgi:hypothetical protein